MAPTLYKFKVKISQIDGKGLFACSPIAARKKIGELSGKIISVAAARRMTKKMKRIAIVELDDKHALSAVDTETPFKYINHSCRPNTYMRVIQKRVEFYALREIFPPEELTCNYGETHHDGQLKCNCKSPFCKGYL
ncbi:MAG: SET domain-containing protein [Bacteroidota bacterium]